MSAALGAPREFTNAGGRVDAGAALQPPAPEADSSPPVLTVTDVSKVYRTQEGATVPAVATVSFDIAEGEFVSIVGPSGCGKTTLMKMCTGLVSTSSGTVGYRDSGAPVKPGTYGMVFQTPALLPWRSILDNVMVPSTVLGLDKKKSAERAQSLLELMQLGSASHKYPSELSGGMQQRAAIARCLIHDPDILFMDEPFGALDAMTREDMNMLLQDMHLDQRKTVVFVTHSIQEAVLLSDRILVMSSGPGRVVADLRVPFARPRTMDDVLGKEFREMEIQIRQLLQPGADKPARGEAHRDDAR